MKDRQILDERPSKNEGALIDKLLKGMDYPIRALWIVFELGLLLFVLWLMLVIYQVVTMVIAGEVI